MGDRYRLEREIGRGGMAIVYLAHDQKTPRTVALKVLHREQTPFIGRDRFLQEIRTIGSLSHPNILSLYDWDEVGGWLYYVSPYMPEGTLREALHRRGTLPLAEALELTRQIGEALQAAHEHHPRHVIHRDVKPGNILLAKGHAFLADFGIARIAASATGPDTDPLTETGIKVGTPEYMSPEQIRGDSDIDPRSDQYALATVLFQMLTAVTPTHLLLTERKDPMEFLARVRPEIPVSIRDALERALSLNRDDRHATVADLLRALTPFHDRTPVVVHQPTPSATPAAIRSPEDAAVTPSGRRRAILFTVGLALVAGVIALGDPDISERLGFSLSVDSTRYAVFPFVLDSGVPPLNERALVRDELGAWGGITLVDEAKEGEVIRRPDLARQSTRETVRAARRLGAGRVVLGLVSRADDSLRIWAGLYSTVGQGHLIREDVARVGGPGPAVGVELRRLTASLLIPSVVGDPVGTPRTSRVLTARQAFEAGRGFIRSWELPRADSAFARAGRADPGFVEASLWLGLVRQWQRADPVRWRPFAEQAMAGRASLGAREQRMTDALHAAAQNDGSVACAKWRELTTLDPRDYLSWFSSALCQMRDTVVVADPASPSRWRFRTSYNSGLQALYRAVRLAPVLLRSFRPGATAELRGLLMVNRNQVRLGRDGRTGEAFLGNPAWTGDSLAFVPYSNREAQTADHRSAGAADAALSHQRDALRELTLLWTEAYPDDPAAVEALAVAMDLTGRREAQDTLSRALSLAAEPADRLRLATTLVWLKFKNALPDDAEGIRAAVRLADSLLAALDTEIPGAPLAGACLAALTGRADLAAKLLRHPDVTRAWGVPPSLAAAAPSLLAYAALGGPVDSIRRYGAATGQAVGELRLESERGQARLEWLARAATLAFPLSGIPGLDGLQGAGDLLLDAQSAMTRHDTLTASRLLDLLVRPMRTIRPSERSLDAVVPEALLFLQLGRPDVAEGWLAAPLDAAAAIPTDLFSDPAITASLGRAMALRVRLAAARGDTSTANRWAGPLRLLWSEADPFLHRELAGLPPFIH